MQPGGQGAGPCQMLQQPVDEWLSHGANQINETQACQTAAEDGTAAALHQAASEPRRGSNT